jgi:hypothetical protein
MTMMTTSLTMTMIISLIITTHQPGIALDIDTEAAQDPGPEEAD